MRPGTGAGGPGGPSAGGSVAPHEASHDLPLADLPPEDLRRAEAAGCRLTGLRAASRHARVHGARAGGRPAVLKVRAGADDPVGRARFAREGRAGLALRHPGLVETLRCGPDWILLGDLGVAGGPAESLHDRVRAAGPDPAWAGRLGGVAAALAHLHARGIVHRDVKPGNVLLGPDGPVLIDLGAAGFAAGDDLGAGEIVGSPAWMAPEQIRGHPPRASADVWSFALVLVHAASGVPAFAGGADAVLAHRRGGGAPGAGFLGAGFLGAVEGLDPGLRRLVRAALSEDPAGRPPVEAFARPAAAPRLQP
ncbi:protein kinase [Methylobacterium sp. NEAU 140]|uniref:protein kinase domain-containing protein n=1 Tax=Methylobacterium sp. NEAU 140 TaxID=3064945 RepID=UPI00273672F2|nr:protein kinase [Methylobacterium sp. NEAU 140]MDP4025142.1 protein kinase [Methylobacterium sp. NEAU 140]